MVLPAMVYKSDPRETIAHFRSVARATDLPIMVYNNPVSYSRGHHAGDVRRAGRRAEAGGDQGVIGERPADHRPRESLRRSLYAVLRGRRPGAREHAAGCRGLGLGPGQRLPGREPPVVGPRHRRPLGRGARGLSLVHAAACIWTLTSSSSSTSSWRSRSAASARRWCAPRGLPLVGEERERILAIIRQGIATRPKQDQVRAVDDSAEMRLEEETERAIAISVIDTHTGGEPTRVVIAGGPELGTGSMAERLAVFRDQHDTFRSAVVNEPRGRTSWSGRSCCRRSIRPPRPV